MQTFTTADLAAHTARIANEILTLRGSSYNRLAVRLSLTAEGTLTLARWTSAVAPAVASEGLIVEAGSLSPQQALSHARYLVESVTSQATQGRR